jgi:hypothetical protein
MQRMPRTGVSIRMKALAAVVVVAAIALVWYLRHPSRTTAARPDVSAHPAGQPAGQPTKPPQHATRITPDQRRALADQIAAAQASRGTGHGAGGAAVSAPARPTLPPRTLDPDDTDGFRTTIRDAMHELIPMITDCYDKAGSGLPDDITVRADLDLTGDPDIGTLVDANKTTDDHDAPLPAGFDDCLRSTLQTIELPPLAEGDHVKVTYPFEFRRN